MKAYVYTRDYLGSKKGEIAKIGPEESFAPCHLENSGIVKRVDAPSDDVGILSFNEETQELFIDPLKTRAEKLAQLRQLRDKKLKDEVDALKRDFEFAEYSVPKSAEQKASLVSFRQELLDATEPFKQNPSLLDNLDLNSALPSKPVGL